MSKYGSLMVVMHLFANLYTVVFWEFVLYCSYTCISPPQSYCQNSVTKLIEISGTKQGMGVVCI